MNDQIVYALITVLCIPLLAFLISRADDAKDDPTFAGAMVLIGAMLWPLIIATATVLFIVKGIGYLVLLMSRSNKL